MKPEKTLNLTYLYLYYEYGLYVCNNSFKMLRVKHFKVKDFKVLMCTIFLSSLISVTGFENIFILNKISQNVYFSVIKVHH